MAFHTLTVAAVEKLCDDAAAVTFEVPDELRGDAALRLYVARATSCEVHVPGRHLLNETGIDERRPANPSGA